MTRRIMVSFQGQGMRPHPPQSESPFPHARESSPPLSKLVPDSFREGARGINPVRPEPVEGPAPSSIVNLHGLTDCHLGSNYACPQSIFALIINGL